MTTNEARRAVKALRIEKRWSVETLLAEMREVLGSDRLSVTTLKRFELGYGTPHPFTLADVTDYLKTTKRRVM